MTILREAYDIAMILCHKNGSGLGYNYTQGNYNTETDEFKMLPRYTTIPSKPPVPSNIPDMTWIDTEDKVMICRYPELKVVEVRQYDDYDLFDTHVAKIKEIEGIE
jgi:hypothetical protein